ncbi:hypothetical protein PLICRDRAFT_39889 [Plicaturopsis crispa FD-325 SS-3]|nr:hypothetical protein PLICRDRAFT_39889 [Plicaturopsis crispa FD-325 SS-3]
MFPSMLKLAVLMSAFASSAISSKPSLNTTVPVFNPPGDGLFPVPHPSLSYWLQGVRSKPLLNHRTTENLPQTADVVVIGSGMSGSLVAYELLKEDPSRKVVILEARETCSGATGRNAGHCKPDQWRGYSKYEKKFGSEQAKKILDNEWETYSRLVDFVRKEQIDADMWLGDTLDVAMTAEIAQAGISEFEAYARAGGNVSRVQMITDKAEAARISRIKGAEAVWRWPATTFYPWKVVAHILESALALGLNLQTHTRVTSVTRAASSASGKPLWSVNTQDRGSIVTPTVVHATNAFAGTLLPLLKDNISPTAFICTKVVPPPSFSGSKALQNSYGVLMPGGALFSINPRTSTDGVILFGGDNPGQPQLDKLLEEHPELAGDDRLGPFKPISDAVVEFAEREFDGWGKFEDMSVGEGVDYSWSGVLGISKDGVPYVGKVPGLEGNWVIAGHNGHGMARIFTAAPSLAYLISHPTEPFAATGLPDVYELTETRLQGLASASEVESPFPPHPDTAFTVQN